MTTNELRDTGRPKRFQDSNAEHSHQTSARAFDTLVASNLQLVKTLRLALGVMVICAIAATLLAAYSTLMLRAGQHDLRDLIVSINGRCR